VNGETIEYPIRASAALNIAVPMAERSVMHAADSSISTRRISGLVGWPCCVTYDWWNFETLNIGRQQTVSNIDNLIKTQNKFYEFKCPRLTDEESDAFAELERLARLGAAVEAMPPLSCLCRRGADSQFEYDNDDGQRVAIAPTAMEAINKLGGIRQWVKLKSIFNHWWAQENGAIGRSTSAPT
jgi:hypothetical protein